MYREMEMEIEMEMKNEKKFVTVNETHRVRIDNFLLVVCHRRIDDTHTTTNWHLIN